MTWPAPVERVSEVLRSAAVDARIEEFEEGTPTARDAAKAVGCELSQIVKTIVLVCDGSFVLALVPGDRRADERSVATALGATDVRSATAREVREATGFEPGGVAPFPQLQIAATLMDRGFLAHEVVWIGAGTDRHMASLPPGELARLTGARAFDLGAPG
jgi:prolyl-tRNA editing enzyme YbaK/EbsC (Cys-tRNA(Pro) deacylase)